MPIKTKSKNILNKKRKVGKIKKIKKSKAKTKKQNYEDYYRIKEEQHINILYEFPIEVDGKKESK